MDIRDTRKLFLITFFRFVSGVTDMEEIVWARDPTEGFILGRMTELLNDGAEVTPVDTKFPKRVLPFSDIFTANYDKDKDYDDNCKLYLMFG